MYLILLCCVLYGIVLSGEDDSLAGAEYFERTLLNTNISCAKDVDCLAHYNNRWCDSGVLCVHRYCRLLAEYPCPRTQRCVESTHRCEPIPCTQDTECDNGRWCDGTEVCMSGQCAGDPNSPNCDASGGVCEERTHRCRMPGVVREYYARNHETAPDTTPGSPGALTEKWASSYRKFSTASAERNYRAALEINISLAPTGAPTAEGISETAVNQTALAVILSFVAVLALAAFIILLIRTRNK